MIKTLKKVIREVVIQGVTTLPLKRNLILRFTKGGRAQENNEECHDVKKENGISRQLKRGNLPSFPYNFSFQ
jgi:hypothetical protein